MIHLINSYHLGIFNRCLISRNRCILILMSIWNVLKGKGAGRVRKAPIDGFTHETKFVELKRFSFV